MAIHLVDSGATISLEFTVDYDAGKGVISAQLININKDDFEVSHSGNYVIVKGKDPKDEWRILYSDVTTPSGASASAVRVLIEAFQDTSASTVTLAAGSALIGKVGIDQTTPGTTNKVSLGTDTITAVTTVTTLTSGNVGGFSVLSVTTPTLSVAGAYATGDYIGTSTTPASFTNVVRASGGTGIIKSIRITDFVNTAAVAMELWIFNATFTAPTDNAAWAATDAEINTCLGVIPISTSKWYTVGSTGKVYMDDTLGIVIKPAVTSLFFALVARGTTPTWANGDLTIALGILQD